MNNPSPDKYTKVSDFEKNHKKEISRGLSRDDCKNFSIFKTTENPGPTDYD